MGVIGQRLVVGHHDDGRARLELPCDLIGVYSSDQQIVGVAQEIEGTVLSDEEGIGTVITGEEGLQARSDDRGRA